MAVPYSFATQTGSIPLSQLDSNFATAITLGNTAVVLGNTYSTIGNLTLSNVTISSGNVSINVSNVSTLNVVTLTVTGNETVGGNVTITGNVSVNVANVTTLNATSSTITGNETVGGNVTVTGNVSVNNATFSNNLTLSGGTANGVAYLNGSKVLTTGSALTFDGTNLGLGVTPSAWGLGKAIEVGYAGNSVWGVASSGDMRLTANAYYNGTNYIYNTTNPAASFRVANGQYYWTTAASGTAGNAITFTQAMTLDNSGNLLVGTTSNASGSRAIIYAAASQDYLTLDGATSSNAFMRLKYNGTGYGAIGFGSGVITGGANTDLGLSATAGNMLFATNGATERMRIDSSGNLLVGTTTGFNARKCLIAYSDVANNGLAINETTGAASAQFQLFSSNGTTCGSIVRVGSTSAVVYNTTSDYRLKNVIGAVSDAGTRLDALQPIEYDWKSGGRTRGFLAHQFAKVYPTSVSGEKDAIDKDGEPVYQSMQASSTEVMADLIAEIQSLRKRVAQLESK